MSVHEAGLVQSPHSPPIPSDITLTRLVKHHTYDAIGRLARTLSPYPSPATQSGGALRSERFYSDGIRRLVEVQIDTVKSLAGALASGNQAYINLANAALALSSGAIDQSAAPAAYEVAYIAAAGPPPAVTTQREYVYGPGDRGVDEILGQFDSAGTPIWLIQDEAGDVVAAMDHGGASNAARIVGVWAYSPYGEVVEGTVVQAHAPIHAGHKGLFVDRLDLGVAAGGLENPRLAAGAVHAGYARNRHLLPAYGRWAQMDPNASGLGTLASAAGGEGLHATINRFNLPAIYGNGLSLYQCLGSNPWMRHDPLGMTWMDALAADMAAGAWSFAQVTIPRLLVQHYAKMMIAGELAAGLAMGDANPTGVGSMWGAGAEEALVAIRGFANGKYTTQMLEEFRFDTFRRNALKLWGMWGDPASEFLKTHHIIPQWGEVTKIMDRMGVGNMVHNPLFSTLLKDDAHKILHAPGINGGANGGWYNQMWFAKLTEFEGRGLEGNDAAKAIIDFISSDVLPAVREALETGRPPAGY